MVMFAIEPIAILKTINNSCLWDCVHLTLIQTRPFFSANIDNITFAISSIVNVMYVPFQVHVMERVVSVHMITMMPARDNPDPR